MANNNLENLLKNARDSHITEDRINEKFEADIINFFKRSIGINEADYKAIKFVSMLIFFCEKNIEKVCVVSTKKGIITPLANELIDHAFEELTFTSKINLYEKIIKKYSPENKDVVKGVNYYRKLNIIRNRIFHCKLKDIKYKEEPITKYETRKLMLEDMIKSCGIETERKNETQREKAARAYKKTKNNC